MLTRENRLTSSQGFSRAVRRGRRAGTGALVLHLAQGRDGAPFQVGLVVGRAVGPAVTRNLVKRRLRHLVRDRLDVLPRSGVLVIRALPPAAVASYSELAADLDRALGRLRTRGEPRGSGVDAQATVLESPSTRGRNA